VDGVSVERLFQKLDRFYNGHLLKLLKEMVVKEASAIMSTSKVKTQQEILIRDVFGYVRPVRL
jgi:hypothetical protein